MSDSISIDDLLETIKKLKLPERPHDPLAFKPMSYAGFDIHEAASAVPVIKLSESVDVTDEFREQFNAWAVKMFGYKSLIPDDRILMFGRNIVMSPNIFAVFQILPCNS